MGKRGRDEVGPNTGVYGLAPAESADDVRMETFNAHRRHLNQRFLEDLQRKINADPFRWLEKEVESYKKHARRLRVRRTSESSAGRASHSPRSFAPRRAVAARCVPGKDTLFLRRGRVFLGGFSAVVSP